MLRFGRMPNLNLSEILGENDIQLLVFFFWDQKKLQPKTHWSDNTVL